MLRNIAIGAILIFVTTVVHAAGMSLALRPVMDPPPDKKPRSHPYRLFLVARVVMIMYLVGIVEVLIWGAAYLISDAVDGFEKAVYFSAVTFTTLGYGDVVLEGSRRILASFEAINGIIMFGWSTAIVIAAVEKAYSRQQTVGS